MRSLIFALLTLAACGVSAPAVPSGADLPAPFTGLPLDTTGAALSTTDDGDLKLKYGGDVEWRGALGRLDAGMTAGGWKTLSTTPIPGGSAITWQKEGKTVQALAGGSKGKVSVLVELE